MTCAWGEYQRCVNLCAARMFCFAPNCYCALCALPYTLCLPTHYAWAAPSFCIILEVATHLYASFFFPLLLPISS